MSTKQQGHWKLVSSGEDVHFMIGFMLGSGGHTGRYKTHRDGSPPGWVQLCHGWTGCGWCCAALTAPCLVHLSTAKKVKKSQIFFPSNHKSTPVRSNLNWAFSTQQQPPSSNVSQANVALWLKSVALVLNWKKNRKTSVSKTVQQLGPKARNSNCSNQILFFKRKPNVFYLGQMCLEHFFLMLCKFYRMLMPPIQDHDQSVLNPPASKIN